MKWFVDGQRGLFPSRALVVPPYLLGRSRSELRVGGDTYLVGDAARAASLDAAEGADRGQDFHGSPRQRAQFAWAFERMKLMNGNHEALLTTLPLNLAYNQSLVQRIKTEYAQFTWEFEGRARRVDFGEVVVTPQGAGAWLLYRRANPEAKITRALVCDIGGATVDLCLIQWREDIQDYDYHLQSRSDEAWNLSVWAQGLMDRLRHELPGRSFDYQDLMAALVQGGTSGQYVIHHLREQIDVSRFVARARDEFTRQVYGLCESACGDLWHSLDDLIITGGGSIFLVDGAWPDRNLPHRMSLFANVEGQHAELSAHVQATAA